MINLRVVVHLCPDLPTAPNTAPVNTIFRSAFSVMMIALFPPNSKIDLPKRSAVAAATIFPTLVEPVKEISGMRSSAFIKSPQALPVTRLLTPSGTPFFANTSAAICWQATAHNGTLEEGFQTQTSPHTQAMAAFQLQTATGKLNAEIIPTTPSGCHCSYMR